MSLSKPTDQEIGDFWLPYDPSSTDQNIPLYVKISDSDYKQIWIADGYCCRDPYGVKWY